MPGSGLSTLQNSLLALLAGALVPLCFSPLNLWPVGPFAIALFYFTLSNSSPRQALWLGWYFGIGFFGVGTSWIYVSIHNYGNAGPLLSVVITALFVLAMALFFALQAWAFRKYAATRFPVAGFAATWVLVEWLRSWLFTGFPWLYLGSAHVTSVISGVAPIFGVFGISFIIALSGALIGQWWRSYLEQDVEKTTALLRAPAALLVLWGVAALSNLLTWVQPLPGNTLSVGIVQGNIEQSLKFQDDYLQTSLDTYDTLSAPLWGLDLVVWPETAIPMYWQNAGAVLDYFGAQAEFTNSTLITGIFYNNGTEIHNSITALGHGSGIWHKQKLVPFGEYVPFRAQLSNLLQLFALPMSSVSPGPAQQDLLTVGEYKVATFICYEVVYPEFVRKYGKDADFLLTISNDTWFGASMGPWQHLQIAALRARELGRYMVRATNDGISALIDERGNILLQSAQFQEDSLQGEIQLFSGSTPFAGWGSWPVLLLSLLLVALNVLQIGRKK